MLEEVACPNCRNPIDIREHGRHVKCDACSSQFVLKGHICPDCNAYHAEEAAFCAECGAVMNRVCAKCGTSNWAGDEYCKKCGAGMDIFDLVALSHKEAIARRAEERSAMIEELNRQEQEAADLRAGMMAAREKRRLAELEAKRLEKEAFERKLLFGAFGLLALVMIVAAIFIFFF